MHLGVWLKTPKAQGRKQGRRTQAEFLADLWSNMTGTMNQMTVDGYRAKIEFDEDLGLFRGEILGLSGGAGTKSGRQKLPMSASP